MNKTYGNWTIDNPNEPTNPEEGKNTRIWATCTCGTHQRVYRAALRAGTTTSCTTCKYKNRHNKWDNTLPNTNNTDYSIGTIHGRLEIISNPIPTNIAQGKRNRTVKVRCTCKTELEVPIGHLLNGNTKSCGCYKREGLQAVNRRQSANHTNNPTKTRQRPNQAAKQGP